MVYFHHLFLHFPIAIAVVALAFLLLSRLMKSETMTGAGYYLLIAGAISALLAMYTGFEASEHIIDEGNAPQILYDHRNWAVIGTILFLIGGAFALFQLKKGEVSNKGKGFLVALAVSFLIAVAIGTAAHLGGTMIHPGIKPFAEHTHSHSHDAGGLSHDHDSADSDHEHNGSDEHHEHND